MRVSIIMPVRNAANWLGETLMSIQKQTLEDWELIAIDDHSTDDSIGAIRSIGDPRIKVVSNEGQGIIAALQTGLRLAQGSFVTRMDADDLMPPNKLETLVGLLINTKERTIATGLVSYFSETTVSEGYRKYETWLNSLCQNANHYDHIYRECIVASPNWMVSRRFIQEDQIFEALEYPEDYDMVFRWHQKGYRIVSSDEVTHLWREHPERTSRNSETYDQASFFQLKMNWFREIEGLDQSIAVFGAGPKGKEVVQNLAAFTELFWYDLQFENFKAGLLGHPIRDPSECRQEKLLIAVYPEKRASLEKYVANLGFSIGKNAWYV